MQSSEGSPSERDPERIGSQPEASDREAEPSTPGAVTPKRRWLSDHIVVAIIAAVAALGGAISGGVATYLGNKDLQESESQSVAVGNARVLQARIVQADARLKFMLQLNLYLAPDPGVGPLTPSIQDEESIAADLSPEQWSTVAVGLSSYSLFFDAAALHDQDAVDAAHGLDDRLDTQHRRMIEDDNGALQAAARALADLTGSP